ncbi:MAG: hypothetical protein ACRD9L_25305, partial [Bryobacteraceae bacterium]
MIGALALSTAVGQPFLVAWAQSATVPGSLFAQSAARILERDFTSRDVSFLLLDVRSGTVLASRWDDAGRAIPMGSLVKPFTALAYGEEHQFRYPTLVCLGIAG